LKPVTVETGRVRLDKWLWAARFYKTRSLAADEIGKGRVAVNGQVAKASRELHVGDEVQMRQPGGLQRAVRVQSLSENRGPAPVAQAMYAETAQSIQARDKAAQDRRLLAEPSQSIEHGRPTKRDRRQLVEWDRWSAALDPD
jgi:ribosome-associated heat shock protein Hsp15